MVMLGPVDYSNGTKMEDWKVVKNSICFKLKEVDKSKEVDWETKEVQKFCCPQQKPSKMWRTLWKQQQPTMRKCMQCRIGVSTL
ncbi:hypothetical protein GN956_G7374 [Arapaima gigas]